MDDLLSEFLTETAESLETIDTELVRFESQPNDKDTLNNIFRLVHTIKGTCGFLGLPRLEAVAHAGETLLGKFRDGALEVTPAAVTLVLESIDQIKDLLSHLEAEGVEPEGDDSELIKRLEDAANGGLQAAKTATAAPTPAPVAVLEDDDLDEDAESEIPEGVDPEKWDAALGRELRPGEVSLADLEAAFNAAEGPEDIQIENAKPASAPETTPETPGVAPTGEKTSLANQTLRVNVDVLEDLMTMVSELVLTRNQLMQMVRNMDDSEFKAPLQRLSNITAELQEGVMKTRMQPIGNAWKKLPRIVRDACQDLNKKIDLVMDGDQTELDRQVLELIKDPLTHMIRNSCDHGVETPEERLANGKPEGGTIHLRAFHEGGHIIIEVADDGAGLKTERIRQKAIEKGVVDAAEAHNMTDGQIHRLIFAPGFSTASKITNISGRGVGMDVVKTNIELIGGAIDLRAKEGEGTTFMIKIPLTLAIISALIVGVGEERFALPQLSVVELVRTGSDREHCVERISNTQVLRLRDSLLPLVSLQDILSTDSHAETVLDAESTSFVVVMQVGDTRFGLVVDEVFDTEEIVVKPLSKALGGVRQYSGATILGDGSVILILDPNGVARAVSSIEGSAQATANAEAQANADGENKMSLLLFRAGGDEPLACPLSLVTRLEDLDADTFERSQSGMVVQYRGRLMPLVHAAGSHMIATEGKQPILVFSQGETVVGVAVDEILDIVHESVNFELTDATPGVLGAAVLKGRTTQVIDVAYHLSQAQPDWATQATTEDKDVARLLLVETHPFFQNMLSPLLQAAGYDVVLAESEDQAIEVLETDTNFDAVLADIDASLSSSNKLASTIAQCSELLHAAKFALSSHDDMSTSNFGQRLPKSDRHALLMALDSALKTRGEAA